MTIFVGAEPVSQSSRHGTLWHGEVRHVSSRRSCRELHHGVHCMGDMMFILHACNIVDRVLNSTRCIRGRIMFAIMYNRALYLMLITIIVTISSHLKVKTHVQNLYKGQ